MSIYAKETKVSVDRTEGEIRTTLQRYGATSYVSGWQGSVATIVFEVKDRRIRFDLKLPQPMDKMFDPSRGTRNAQQRQAACEQEHRARWRALALCIKAKLESVEVGIETFDEAFMSHIVLPGGGTVGDHVSAHLPDVLQGKKMPPLLGSGK